MVFTENCTAIRRKSFLVYVLRHSGDECMPELFIMIWSARQSMFRTCIHWQLVKTPMDLTPFHLKYKFCLSKCLALKGVIPRILHISLIYDYFTTWRQNSTYNRTKNNPLNFRIQYLGACKYTPTISAFQRKHKWTFVIFATVVTSYTVQKNFRFTKDISIHIKSCHIYTQKRSSCLLVGTRAAHWRYTPNCPRYCI